MATPQNEMPALIKRTVIGNKPYHWYDHHAKKDEEPRRVAIPGSVIMVKLAEAKAFPHRLQDADVAKAQKAADDAIKAADVAIKDAEVKASIITPIEEVTEPIVDTSDDDDDDTTDVNDTIELISQAEFEALEFQQKRGYAQQFGITDNSHDGLLRELLEANKFLEAEDTEDTEE